MTSKKILEQGWKRADKALEKIELLQLSQIGEILTEKDRDSLAYAFDEVLSIKQKIEQELEKLNS